MGGRIVESRTFVRQLGRDESFNGRDGIESVLCSLDTLLVSQDEWKCNI